jgi:hypothetical protein
MCATPMPNMRFNPTYAAGGFVSLLSHRLRGIRGLTWALGSASNGKQSPATSSMTAVYRSWGTVMWLHPRRCGYWLAAEAGVQFPHFSPVGRYNTRCFMPFRNVLWHQRTRVYYVRGIGRSATRAAPMPNMRFNPTYAAGGFVGCCHVTRAAHAG